MLHYIPIILRPLGEGDMMPLSIIRKDFSAVLIV